MRIRSAQNVGRVLDFRSMFFGNFPEGPPFPENSMRSTARCQNENGKSCVSLMFVLLAFNGQQPWLLSGIGGVVCDSGE